MKKIITKITIALIVIAISVLSLVPLDGVQKGEGSDWMKNLQDSASLNSISIPGTHDSGAIYSIADVAGKCQSLTIDSQLNAGVRFFDIRLKQNGNKLDVVHSFVDQKTDFENVLSTFENFLKSYPTEFLIVSIKEDADSVNATQSFAEQVEKALKAKSSCVSLASSLPTLVADARGKIHFISRYKNATIGVKAYSGWRDCTSFELGPLFVQDNYELDGYQDKKADVLNAFEKANNQSYGLVLNFLSGYQSNGFPPSYAPTTAREMNAWVVNELSARSGCVGVVIFDFVTVDLAKNVYGRNFR